ncbi:MAG: ABC transporter permease [Gammaproteobacteria bacterium]|nr:ABC transporter permease [Gammaproteobacteria bacterium]
MSRGKRSTTGFLATVLTVLRKEWLDFARDRRSLVLSLLVAPLIYPPLFLGGSKLAELRVGTQLEQTLSLPVAGMERAPNLVRYLASYGIEARVAPPDIDARIRAQQEDLALAIDADFAADWQAGRPAAVDVITDSTRRTADVSVARVRAVLEGYSRSVGALRLLVRGIDPRIAAPLSLGTRDMATPEARNSSFMSMLLPMLLTLLAFIGSAHLAMDTTAGERERQSLEPLLATSASRVALVSGKMLAAVILGLLSMLLVLLAFKLTATLAVGDLGRQMDVSLPAIARLLLTLLPLALIGTALITALAAGARSMKEAQSHMVWLMLLPMLAALGLMSYPLKDTALWQYAVPFLSQYQLIQKITRGEAASPEQWALYLAAALALAALLTLLAVWRYRQEKLAISA